MRAIRLSITMLGALLFSALMLTVRAGTSAQADQPTNTLDPLDETATAFVAEHTLTAAAQGFSAQSAPPLQGGTPTPVSGLCNSMSFRVLSSVAQEIDRALTDSDFDVDSVEVTAIEDTEDCITFAVHETEALVMLTLDDTVTLYDEGRIGSLLQGALDAMRETSLLDYPDTTVEIRFVVGRQTRSIEIDYAEDNDLLYTDFETPLDFLNALTEAE